MFGIGMPELIVIFVIALLVFGPKELPKIGRAVGKAMGEFRRASDELREGIQREIDLAGRVEPEPAPPGGTPGEQAAQDSVASAAPDSTEPATPVEQQETAPSQSSIAAEPPTQPGGTRNA
jgi:TatA/E family protein of Tat protein translocase